MLLDAQGHLKLADFGTCMRMDNVSHDLLSFHICQVIYYKIWKSKYGIVVYFCHNSKCKKSK